MIRTCNIPRESDRVTRSLAITNTTEHTPHRLKDYGTEDIVQVCCDRASSQGPLKGDKAH